MLTGRRRIVSLIVAAAATTSLAVGGAPALAAAPAATATTQPSGDPSGPPSTVPSIRLIVPKTSVVIHRFGKGGPAYLDAGVLVAATGGAFDVRVERPDYTSDPVVWQVLNSSVVRILPSDIADGFLGLKDFYRLTLTNSHGKQVVKSVQDFCPSGQNMRIDSTGPQNPTYPGYCYDSPFMLGTVFGIDQGWSVPVAGNNAPTFDGKDGLYTMRVSILPRYRQLFGISDANATAVVSVKIKTGGPICVDICPPPPHPLPHGTLTSDGSLAPTGVQGPPLPSLDNAPTLTSPPADAVPDLIALPAWSITLDQHNHKAAIDFAATIWDKGPSPLVVEGFRGQNQKKMDAYQYFMKDGQVVGRARVGQLEFDTRPGHHHWHFEQFARYSLLDSTKTHGVVSEKQSFCLAPTDAIDLAVPSAQWQPYSTGLGTACAGPNDVWMREVLDTGWGDTYYQSVAGQSLDVTNLPNGVYYLSVEANPKGLLYEGDTSNNTALRKVILGGTPGGRRTLVVKPWHGINA